MRGDAALHPVEAALLAAPIPVSDRVLVAVSGGPDSVALLLAMQSLAARGEGEWTLRAGHVNHGLRGSESDLDERFVQSLCQDLGIEFMSAQARPREEHAGSVEAWARRERYRLLREMRERWPGDLIATAHTQDDQAETVLLHLLRGAGITGVGAMRPSRGDIVRPFLGVSHEAVLDYLQRTGGSYRLDSSNLDLAHTRNRIRHAIMPALRAVTSDPHRLLARSAELAHIDAEYMAQEVEAVVDALHMTSAADEAFADRHTLRALHPALRRAGLRCMVALLTGSVTGLTASHVEVLDDLVSSHIPRARTMSLPDRIHAIVGSDRLTLRRGDADALPRLDPAVLRVPGSTSLSVGELSARELDASELRRLPELLAVSGPYHALCRCDRMTAPVRARSRLPGDRIRPVGLGGSRKVQDILVDRKVPVSLRGRVVIIEDAEGIIWIPGFALSERAAAAPDSDEVMHLSFSPSIGLDSARIARHF